jgi:hypothetical protein
MPVAPTTCHLPPAPLGTVSPAPSFHVPVTQEFSPNSGPFPRSPGLLSAAVAPLPQRIEQPLGPLPAIARPLPKAAELIPLRPHPRAADREGIEAILEAYDIPASPFQIEMYERGLAIQGAAVAFDLDGTLIDFATVHADEAYRIQLIQPKPGMEAFLLGLSVSSYPSLATASDATRVRALFEHLPAMQQAFVGEEKDEREEDEEGVTPWRRVFTGDDFIVAVKQFLDWANTPRTELTELDQRLLWQLFQHQGRSRDLLHLKSPHLAGFAGKAPFDILVDDSEKVERLLADVGESVHLLRIPSRADEPYPDLEASFDDAIVQVADQLARPPLDDVTHIRKLEALPSAWARSFTLDLPPNSWKARAATLDRLLRRESPGSNDRSLRRSLAFMPL